MQEFRASTNGQSSTSAGDAQTPHYLITPKRVGYTVASAFVFVSAAVMLAHPDSAQKPASASGNITLQHSSTSSSTSPEDPAAGAAQHSSSSVTVTSGGSEGDNTMHVQVNGQPVEVPDNGTTDKTISNEDGSTTNLSISNSTSSQGSAQNSSTTNFSLDVHTNSSTSGGSATP